MEKNVVENSMGQLLRHLAEVPVYNYAYQPGGKR